MVSIFHFATNSNLHLNIFFTVPSSALFNALYMSLTSSGTRAPKNGVLSATRDWEPPPELGLT